MVDALNLQARINADVVANTPPSLAAMVDRMVADLRERGVTPGIAVGELAPDFEAPDPHGAVVRLADRLARGPVVLSFYRGAWCPICSIELRALRETLPALRARGASLVAISPQSPDDTSSVRRVARPRLRGTQRPGPEHRHRVSPVLRALRRVAGVLRTRRSRAPRNQRERVVEPAGPSDFRDRSRPSRARTPCGPRLPHTDGPE